MALRRLHAVVAIVFVAAILVQVFLAGAALLQLGGSGDFRTHVDFGYTAVGLAALALVVTSLVARTGRTRVLQALGLLVLYVVQTSLPYARASIPAIAALHPVNALLLFAFAAWYARQAWREQSVPA